MADPALLGGVQDGLVLVILAARGMGQTVQTRGANGGRRRAGRAARGLVFCFFFSFLPYHSISQLTYVLNMYETIWSFFLFLFFFLFFLTILFHNPLMF